MLEHYRHYRHYWHYPYYLHYRFSTTSEIPVLDCLPGCNGIEVVQTAQSRNKATEMLPSAGDLYANLSRGNIRANNCSPCILSCNASLPYTLFNTFVANLTLASNTNNADAVAIPPA